MRLRRSQAPDPRRKGRARPTRGPRIAVLGTRGFPGVQGGVETHCQHLYPELVKLGCEVTVFARRPYVGSGTWGYRGVRLISLWCPRNRYLEALIHSAIGVLLARILRADIVHIHAIGPSIVAPLAVLLGMKVVVRNVGADFDRKKWGSIARAVLLFAEYCGTRWSQAVICVNNGVAQRLQAVYGRCDCMVIPNGVPRPHVRPTVAAVAEFGLTPSRYVLAVGRLVPEKGFDLLLDAFERIDLPGWKLAIVGAADHPDGFSMDLESRACQNQRVVLTGRLNGTALEELYSHAGLFILPSYHEGMSFSLLEALSYGIPCLVSDIPANREVGLEDGQFFRSGDVAALVSAIVAWMSQPQTRQDTRWQRERILREHAWPDIAARTLGLYLRVLGDGNHERYRSSSRSSHGGASAP